MIKTSVLCVDPGVRNAGCALFQTGTLVRAALVKNPITRGDDAEACMAMARAIGLWAGGEGTGFGEVVVERMQAYDPSKQKGDQNDLITLSLIAGMLRPTWLYLPRTWKGQVPKGTMGERILGRLTEAEKERIEDAGALTHNVIDAVGIGLYHLGRLAPRRVFHR